MLINSYAERCQRQQAKRALVLNFLASEIWTGFSILQGVLGLSEPATLRTLGALERQGLIRRHRVGELRASIWGITAHGLVMGGPVEEPAIINSSRTFEPSKVKTLGIAHKISTQEARLAAERAGWTEWRATPETAARHHIQPDAVARDIAGRAVAIEVERTVKSKKRYEAIFAAYLQIVKSGEIDLIHYVCPDRDFAPRLARMFGTIKAVPILGERVTLNDRHRARFQVYPLETWPLEGGIDIFDRANVNESQAG
jgi:hypothetical protein